MAAAKQRAEDSVCIAAILKDEDAFVEEWVAYHRLLGVDHFYLYDNDPRQPLRDILALHQAYVTVQPWLIDHDDQRYPGRNKQLKAYAHCLAHDASGYAWVTFIDCDEFIALEEHPDLKAFLAEFTSYDCISLNWYVFGHNGYYEDPPGLIIESLTRRMKEPRAMVKSLTRPEAIASIDSPHVCRLKKGRKWVDANKRPYRDKLYPGKTRLARINHYQCRSFVNWMRKPERGEAGTFVEDTANAWRFSQEACLRQFVTKIAMNKNEHVDSSMAHHVEPVTRYLRDIRQPGDSGNRACEIDRAVPTMRPKIKARAGEAMKIKQPQQSSADRRLEVPTSSPPSRTAPPPRLARGLRRLARLLVPMRNDQSRDNAGLHSSGRRKKATAQALAACEAQTWVEATMQWQRVFEEFGSDLPAKAFLAWTEAHERLGDLDGAERALGHGRIHHPANINLATKSAHLATLRKNWPEVARRWQKVIEEFGDDAPPRAFLRLSRAYERQGCLDAAGVALQRGRARHPESVQLATRHAEIAMMREDWPEAVEAWEAVRTAKNAKPTATVYLQLSRALRCQSALERAEKVLLEGAAHCPEDVSLIVELAELAMARENRCQAAERWEEVLGAIQAKADPAADMDLLATACMGLIRCRDYQRVLTAARNLKPLGFDSKILLAIEGIAYLRPFQMDAASRHWDSYWKRTKSDVKFLREKNLITKSDNTSSKDFFPTCARIGDYVHDRKSDRVCVYTALFGEYDNLRPPLYAPPGLAFICFSDRPRPDSGWEVRIVDLALDSPVMKNRMLKILPYDHLKDYECSLYVDASVAFLGDPLIAYAHWLRDQAFVAWSHPLRSGVYEEIEVILAHARHEPRAMLDQYQYFRESGVPQQTGLIEAGFLWRDHRDPVVRELMEQWWNHLARFGSGRDQPALSYLMWKTGVRPTVLPEHLGTSRSNEYFYTFPHAQSLRNLGRSRITKFGKAHSGADEIANRGPAERRPNVSTGTKRTRLTWVRRDEFKAVASTHMRGYQLSEIARQNLDDTEVHYVDESRLNALSDSVVILTKGFLKKATLNELALLRDRRNIICADYVDDPAREELHDWIDVYIASSISQFVHLSASCLDKVTHLITHHPDPRISGMPVPEDHCRIGYFGEMVNARYATELQELVDFHPINTKTSSDNWLTQLGNYNLHYAIRNRRSIDGFKPFLKGFVAAQCQSNIILSLDESDARYYLGSDYPYILRDDSLESVMRMLEYVKASFGGAEWHRGLEIMKSVRQRCSPAQIAKELRALLDRYQ